MKNKKNKKPTQCITVSTFAKVFCSSCNRYSRAESVLYSTFSKFKFILLLLCLIVPGIIYYFRNKDPKKQLCCSICGLPDYVTEKTEWNWNASLVDVRTDKFSSPNTNSKPTPTPSKTSTTKANHVTSDEI